MHTFTALFDHRDDAEAVQAKLQTLGIVDLDHGLHDRESADIAGKGPWSDSGGALPPVADRHLYDEAVRRGGFLLTVNVDDQEAPQVLQVLHDSKAVDFDERERELRQSGYTPPPTVAATDEAGGEDRIALAQEELVVGKRSVERGGVRVRAYVVETEVREDVQLREEHLDVQRRAVNTPVAGDAEALFEERSVEVAARSEEAVVAKETRVVEEVSLAKVADSRVETVKDSVRHTEVEVERLPPEPKVD